jgi:hypothetical protein
MINVKDFGAVDDGETDDTDALEAAIQSASSFLWKTWEGRGSTRRTELAPGSGAVYFPRGEYRITRKLKLTPTLRLFGDGTGNDFTVRDEIDKMYALHDIPEPNKYQMGSCILCDINDPNTYAIDTCSFDRTGTRLNDAVSFGLDSWHGYKIEVHNVNIENMTIFGRYTCKGINLAGAVKCRLSNVMIKGFTVGIRLSAVWYGALEDVRVMASWRGIIAFFDITNLTYRNVSVSCWGPAYDPNISGYDGSEPPPGDTEWTSTINRCSAGFYSFYGGVTGFQVTCEGYDVGFMSWNARDFMPSVYVEGIKRIICCARGPDNQNCRYIFNMITSCNGSNLLWSRTARLDVDVLTTNYTRGSFSNIGYVDHGEVPEYKPVLRGIS